MFRITSITLLMLVALTIVAGCTALPVDSTSPDYLPAVGGTVELQRPIEVPAGRTRVFLQQGRVLLGGGLDHKLPSCNIELRELADFPRRIEPGPFRILRVQRLTEEVVRSRVSATGLIKVGMEDDGDGAPDVMHGVHLYLKSGSQPGVMRLTCRGALEIPWKARPPTLAEIREALGTVMILSP